MNIVMKNLLLIIFILLLVSFTVNAQETDEEKNAPVSLQQYKYSGSRGYQGAFAKESKVNAQGNAKYLRFSVHDGNLVTGGIVNSGLLSYHYVSGTPRLGWPKGSNLVEYLHSGVFYVGAEVVDERGDTVHIISDNYRRSNSEAALDQSHFYGFMPVGKYFNNDETNATSYDMPGISEDVGKDGVPGTGDEGEGDGILQPEEDFNLNGELDLSMVNEAGWFAISHRRETWPLYWPAGSYPGDNRNPGDEIPGVRQGRWNGEFGAYARADQESYYVMDDRENDEFLYYPFDDSLSRLDWPNGRRGLGIEVEVRNYQWSSRLAEDILISIYDVTNKGKDLNKAVVGMYVDPDLGGSLSGDDASFDEVDDITYAFNRIGLASNGLPIGYFGFAFLESPGLARDGIDNDEDGMIDESQNNGIDDDGDWTPFEDLNGNGVWDSEDLNSNGILDSGEDVNNNGILDIEPLNDDLGSDGLGPGFDEYTGPDADGTQGNSMPDLGEPNFEFTDNDESDQVGLTSFYLRRVDNTMANDEAYWDTEIKPGVFTVKPGYQGDIAWSYGSGYVEFAGIEKTHRYAIALLFGNNEEDILRNKKTMQIIYDEDYSFTKPPRKPRVTAQGGDGKVFLSWDSYAESSRDPIYGEDFEAYYIYKSTEPSFNEIKTITDAFGNPLLFKPLAIFDKIDGLKGIHPVNIGEDLGPESDLGIAYNMGTDSGLKHYYIDDDVTNGRTYYYAVVSVDRGYHESFYPDIIDKENLIMISPTECTSIIQTDLLGRAISTDQNTVIVMPTEPPAGWIAPDVSDIEISQFAGTGTGSVELDIYNEISVKPGTEYEIYFGDNGEFMEYSTHYTGVTNFAGVKNLTTDVILDGLADPDTNPLKDEFIIDGLKIIINNDTTRFDTAYWKSGNSNLDIISTTEDDNGVAVPRDYEIRVLDMGAGASVNSTPVITNFQVWDVTFPDSVFEVNYRYVNREESPENTGYLSYKDKIQLVSDYSNTKRLWIFEMILPDSLGESDQILPLNGDVLKINTKKAFTRNDAFRFTIAGNEINNDKAKDDLNNIYTVPDPYVAVSTLERHVINEDEGRGDRRIDFVNLPQECTINIFTTAGRLVRTLNHSSSTNLSRKSWDLRTKDGLEIAPGIYYYVVTAPGIGEKTGRLAVIK